MTGTRGDGIGRAVAAAVLTGIRRIVTVAVELALIPVAAALLVVVTVLTAPFSALRGGRWRLVRVFAFAALYLVVDFGGFVRAGLIWLRYPPLAPEAVARRTNATYALLDGLLRLLVGVSERLFGLSLRVTPPVRAVPDGTAPLIVLARHAGPGDSFLLVHVLLSRAETLPRIVLKRVLRLDPCLDVIMGRLPHCFVPARRGRTTEDAMADLARDMRPGDALVIFPEGANYTERRHRRAIASLRRRNEARAAARAERLHHVLPPHATGTLAALAAAPGADVVFVAHTGLDAIDSVSTAWSGVPLREQVRARWWRVPAAEVPRDDEARKEWLTAQWSRVDRWIEGH
ncbi:1-acyl-sn-glycerol-3-phosphate acyltransferase [Streptomyces sp. PTM05]|uniref:1-acyl-sn-glycerol-3-phosphate acyltransferase n=1 Tax=Streptantibioticus parmotrematis TaxID=2873249 RepID=A0ABS7QU36_9ACTN|nr:1-acyl-sn-glycerol-3-phosphate acyltransferase [Streptantibioticus parmotrematis]MBY8885332.1 1-acyl-sn-glycerol-3-phosphate acyltransferase [Streptantibioticus parmotrematis]